MSRRVLVVEDDDAVRAYTAEILRELGYSVAEVSSAKGALAILRNKDEFDLLLTDVVMPNMSGRQVADRLLPTRPGLKVLYLSGYTDNTVVHHGVLEPGVEFLPKPFSREVLSEKIRDLLAK